MRISIHHLPALALACAVAVPVAAETRRADVVVYGATSSGIAAAIEASRLGKSVLLVNPNTHVGGLTTGGLGWTDIGNKQVIGGIAREFYQRIKAKYGAASAWRQQTREEYYTKRHSANVAGEDAMWTFEPKVATAVFAEMLAERKIGVINNARLVLTADRGVIKRGARIEAIVMENGDRYEAKMFIDATYEGDLMAKAGVSYTVGRESNSQYGENYNGVQAEHRHGHQFPDGVRVSPYVVAGNPASGLLPGVDPKGPGTRGQGDLRVQAYCFRMCMTDAPENRVAIEKPAGYNERDHEMLLRYAESGRYHSPASKWDPLPNRKTDTNNHGAVSTDYIGMNYDYPDGDYATRERIIRNHRVYTQGYLWTLQNNPRVPEKVRDYYRQWGLPKDEFTENGNWPTQLYIREARRMTGEVVMNENHITAKQTAADSVGMGAYGMDSHNVQRYITAEGFVRNEGNVQVGGFAPYPISYRAIVPKRAQASNLLVPVCLSASHIAYGSIRMEPVFMVLGQSAAAAAAFAIDANRAVQDVDYSKLRARLLETKQILEYKEPVRPGAIDIAKLEGIVLDDSKAEKTDGWAVSRATPRYLGLGYLHDGDARNGEIKATFKVAVPAAGRYKIRVLYPPMSNRASNANVTVAWQGGKKTFPVNQKNEPAWLGPLELPAAFTVSIDNNGANGYVVLDGLQIVAVK